MPNLWMVMLCAALSPVACAIAQDHPSVETIIERMMTHNDLQDRRLKEYEVMRTFYAANPRFKLDATLLVQTSFQQPEKMDSKVMHLQGSQLIREHVFDKILEAENETRTKKAKRDVDLTPANYNFRWIGSDDCGGRSCYHLGLSPKRKDKYALEGEVWIDAEDYAIVRVHGSPSKRPSFWTTRTEIDRRYKRTEGVWLTDRIESNSDIRIAGHSHLSIDYAYQRVKVDPEGRP
jgi:hypothetical protein